MDIDADNDNAVIRSRCRKQGVKMVIILSFRPNNTLSAQSVWFKFMYTFNRINFSTNSIELRIYTATIISVHASVISRKCCRIPFCVCGLVPLVFFWATTHISTQLHEFCPEFLNFLVGFVSTSFRFFVSNLFRMKMNYTHIHNLCALYHFISFNTVLQIFKTNIIRWCASAKYHQPATNGIGDVKGEQMHRLLWNRLFETIYWSMVFATNSRMNTQNKNRSRRTVVCNTAELDLCRSKTKSIALGR